MRANPTSLSRSRCLRLRLRPRRAAGHAARAAAAGPEWPADRPAGRHARRHVPRLVAAQAEPGWIGYSVPVVSRSEGRLCCTRRHLDLRRHRLHERPARDVRARAVHDHRRAGRPTSRRRCRTPSASKAPTTSSCSTASRRRRCSGSGSSRRTASWTPAALTIQWLDGVERRRLGEAAVDVRVARRGEVRSPHRCRDQRDRDAQGRGGRRGARAVRDEGQSGVRPQEGHLLDGQRARRAADSRR